MHACSALIVESLMVDNLHSQPSELGLHISCQSTHPVLGIFHAEKTLAGLARDSTLAGLELIALSTVALI